MRGEKGMFRVHLYNTAGSDEHNFWNRDAIKGVGDELVSLFMEVILSDRDSPFMGAEWADGWCCDPEPWELLVYLVATQRRHGLLKRHKKVVPEAAGATFPIDGRVLSEVYIGKNLGGTRDENQKLLANLAFHELMHNKLDATVPPARGLFGNDPVHDHGGAGWPPAVK